MRNVSDKYASKQSIVSDRQQMNIKEYKKM